MSDVWFPIGAATRPQILLRDEPSVIVGMEPVPEDLREMFADARGKPDALARWECGGVVVLQPVAQWAMEASSELYKDTEAYMARIANRLVTAATYPG